MHYCPDCKTFIEDPIIKNYKISGKRVKKRLCPVCFSELTEASPEYCLYCGNRLGESSAGGYCNSTCRRLGLKLWTRELVRRKKIKDDPIARILRLLTSYNRDHGTRYSYGQFVALILPGLNRGKKTYGY